MKRFFIRIWVLSVALQLLVGGALAQTAANSEAWKSKPVSEWSEGDVKDILQNSAWSKHISGRPTHTSRQLGTIMYESHLLFTLRSSLVVRFAIIRSEQLKAKYDSMDAKAKAEFGNRFKPILDCALCEKSYIVAVRGDSELLRLAGRVKYRAQDIYLSNEKGEKRELASFSPQTIPGSEALFFFNRFDANGKPLLTPDNEVLTFNFKLESGDDSIINLLERVDIKVRDIVMENQVVF
jgi:hypothetical protein